MPRPRPYPWLIAGITAAAVAAVRSVVRVEVGGSSMVPTLLPGDRVLAVRTLAPRVGDVAALVDPRVTSRLLVKRVVAVHPNGSVEVAGDNAVASTDSRSFGRVAAGRVTGRVVWRYWPPERRGPLDRRTTRVESGGGSGSA
ncbi:MAG: S26 family signal peptidase [Actinomycetota bacterium]|nr:S26 family signal peptidase [Actinomycetota bacterium]